MMKLALSSAAAGLLRALIARSGAERQNVVLVDFRSVDWQSLTFIGERHEMTLRLIGAGAADACDRIVDQLDDSEFAIAGQILADIAVSSPPQRERDGSITLGIEALTLVD